MHFSAFKFEGLISMIKLGTTTIQSRDSAVGLATGYALSRSSDSVKNSLLQIFQTGSGVQPTSYKWVPGGSVPGGKAAGT
jgi:hypothetical protein